MVVNLSLRNSNIMKIILTYCTIICLCLACQSTPKSVEQGHGGQEKAVTQESSVLDEERKQTVVELFNSSKAKKGEISRRIMEIVETGEHTDQLKTLTLAWEGTRPYYERIESYVTKMKSNEEIGFLNDKDKEKLIRYEVSPFAALIDTVDDLNEALDQILAESDKFLMNQKN